MSRSSIEGRFVADTRIATARTEDEDLDRSLQHRAEALGLNRTIGRQFVAGL